MAEHSEHSFADLGHRVSEYGPSQKATTDEIIIELFTNKDYNRLHLSVMSSLLSEAQKQTQEMRWLRAELACLPGKLEKARLREERDLEKEKQKTAKAQLKVAEASRPVEVTVLQMRPEEIERAANSGRVRRRF